MKQIQKTKNYDQFKFISHNRPIVSEHVELLKASIEQNNMLFMDPIAVNGDFEVMDGQHRLQAARALGVDIYYVQDDSLKKEVLITLNSTSKRWKAEDYINYYAEEGKRDFILIRSLCAKYKMRATHALCFSNVMGGNGSRMLKEGKIKMLSEGEIERIMELVNQTKDIVKQRLSSKEYSFFSSRAFFRSLILLFTNEEVNPSIFFKKLPARVKFLQHNYTTSSYIDALERIYNHYNQIPVKLYDNPIEEKKDFVLES